MDLYRHYQSGHLAVSGGALDQPAIYAQTMKFIDAGLHGPEEKDIDEQLDNAIGKRSGN